MIDDCNINNLAKNQVSAVFNSRAICRSVSSKFIEICIGRHVGAHLDGHQHGGRKPTETSVTELLQKRKFISRGTQKPAIFSPRTNSNQPGLRTNVFVEN